MAQRIDIFRRHAVYPTLDQLSESLNLRHRTLADIHREQHRLLDHLPQAYAVGLSRLDNLPHRCIADTTRRIIDDTLEGLLIIRIRNQSEIRNHILDLLALIEAQSAIDAIRDIILSHLFLKGSALRVRTIENGKVGPITMILPPEALDVLTHDHRLLLIAIGRLQLQPLTMFVFREHILRNLSFISFDQRIGCLYDQLRRAVVLLQLEQFCIFIQTLKVQDIIDIGTSERIDALGIIAHHAHFLTFLRQLIHNRLLRIVRILILIHQHEMELLNVFLPDILMILEQEPCLNQQIVKVHRIRLTTPFRVPYIYIRDLRTLLGGIVTRPGTLCIGLRQQQMILGHRDTVGHRRRLIRLIVKLHLLDDRLHQRTGIRLVIDGEVSIKADMLGLAPQDPCKHTVEGTHLQVSGLLIAHQAPDTLLHLSRCLIGKRQCQNLPGSHPLFQQPRNLIGQHTCLTRACSGNHQTCPVAVLHGNLLPFIQLL